MGRIHGRYTTSIHDSPEKIQLLSSVDVFQVDCGDWIQQATSGTPPLGVSGYRCTAVGDYMAVTVDMIAVIIILISKLQLRLILTTPKLNLKQPSLITIFNPTPLIFFVISNLSPIASKTLFPQPCSLTRRAPHLIKTRLCYLTSFSFQCILNGHLHYCHLYLLMTSL